VRRQSFAYILRKLAETYIRGNKKQNSKCSDNIVMTTTPHQASLPDENFYLESRFHFDWNPFDSSRPKMYSDTSQT